MDSPLPEEFHVDDKFESLYGRSPFEGMLNYLMKTRRGLALTRDDFRWVAGLPGLPEEPEN